MKSLTLFAVLAAFYVTNVSAACTSPNANIFIPASYLTNLSLKQDSPIRAATVTDSSGRLLSPAFAWIKVWYSNSEGDTVASIRDIKIALPTHNDALEYVAAASRQFSEGAPEAAHYQYKGTDVTVYGPRPAGPSPFGNAISPITAYAYVSVTDNVISKVFVMQGFQATAALAPDRGKVFANAVTDNIALACK
jgi:hypothetical protein